MIDVLRGSAAAQCGKAPPYRACTMFFRGYAAAPPCSVVATGSINSDGQRRSRKRELKATVRQSLTTLGGGGAASWLADGKLFLNRSKN